MTRIFGLVGCGESAAFSVASGVSNREAANVARILTLVHFIRRRS
jgi:hypothetical protein